MASIPLTIKGVQQSLAHFIKTEIGDQHIYTNPNQQGTKTPAWFILFIPLSGIRRPTVSHIMRKLQVDLVCESDYNLTDVYDIYYERVEKLDDRLHLLTYNYTDLETGQPGSVRIRAYDKEWNVNRQALHYKFRLDLLASKLPEDTVKMRIIEELNEFVNDYQVIGGNTNGSG